MPRSQVAPAPFALATLAPAVAAAGLAVALGVAVGACGRAATCDGLTCAATCPRDASRDPSGRCACAGGTVPVLGACVPPTLADAFCGPAAVAGPSGGCAFRACPPGETLDVASGACASRALLKLAEPDEGAAASAGAGANVRAGAGANAGANAGEAAGANAGEAAGANVRAGAGANAAPCRPPAFALLENGAAACAPPEAACPRGTTLAGPTDAGAPEQWPAEARCVPPPRCPAGTLAEHGACRLIVTGGGHWTGSWPGAGDRVDLGAWAAIALGIDGGTGSAVLCQPLLLRPSLLAGARAVHLVVALRVPDQDISRVEAHVRAWTSEPPPDVEAQGPNLDALPGSPRGTEPEGPGEPGETAAASAPPSAPSAPDGGAERPLSPAAQALVEASVRTLIEPLRALGGESASASIDVALTCAARSP